MLSFQYFYCFEFRNVSGTDLIMACDIISLACAAASPAVGAGSESKMTCGKKWFSITKKLN